MSTTLELIEESQNRGFIGPGSLLPQIEHAKAFARFIPPEATSVLDLGSGGGLPGLVLAEADGRDWILLDAMEKRCVFLSEAVDALGLGYRVNVLCGRAEDIARQPELRERLDVVVARSFVGGPPVLAECATGFVRVGGVVVVSEPPGETDRWEAEGLAKLGLEVGTRLEDPQMVSLHKVSPLDDAYPRRSGIPTKRPLWGST